MEFSFAIRETKSQIVTVLNDSGLPIDAMDMLLGEIRQVVHEQAEKEYQELLVQRSIEDKKPTNEEEKKDKEEEIT